MNFTAIKDCAMSVLGEVCVGVVIFFGGMMLAVHLLNKDCAAGKPTVIDGIVYQCVRR